jgi:Family of unknown function (DUF6247)
MTAEPIGHEDPQVILRRLPEHEREFFLHQYHAAVDEAHQPAGYRRLQEFLHAWSVRVIAVNQPGYRDELEEVSKGTAETVPIEQVIADRYGISPQQAEQLWERKVAEAAERHR